MSDEGTEYRLAKRVVVRTEARDALRQKYADACQVCGRVTALAPGETYAEVHALGSAPGDEPDDATQPWCVVLCPEHHALFDAGVMAIDPDELTVHCANRRDRFDGRPLAKREHAFSTEALRVAWKARVEPPPDQDDGSARHRTIEALVEFLFTAAVDEDEEAGFERYLSLIPGGLGLPPASRETHRKFAWAQLRRRADSYLVDGRPDTYHIVATQPSTVTADTEKARVMLASRGRNPAPLKLERGEDGAWWLEFMGL